MPINRTVKGDLIQLAKEGHFDVICHGSNCFCNMGSGIAPQIKEAFPDAWQADQLTVKGDKNKLGTYSVGYDSSLGLRIVNMYTQYSYGKGLQLDYSALKRCFEKLSNLYCNNPGVKVGIPMIGCGLAGGHWDAVREIINLVTPNLDITYVEYNK